MIKKKGLSIRQREIITGLLFISPWLVGISWFFLRNMAQTVRFSFNKLEMLDEGGFTLAPVGWSNYTYSLLENVNFNRELTNSVFQMLYNVPMIIFFSLFMALILNRKFALRGMVRAIFFLPVIMATTAITSSLEQIMLMMMGGVSSISPEVMRTMEGGFDAMSVAFLLMDFGMPMQVIGYIIEALAGLFNVIRASGVQIIIFLAALQAIPGSLYEVAQIEGATGYESFWKITFPMVSPLILTNVIYTIIDTYSQSTIVEIAYYAAFSRVDFGLSAAMSILSALVSCLFLLLVSFGISRYVYYHN
jgi:ABC-type sugar transport system permease subunit